MLRVRSIVYWRMRKVRSSGPKTDRIVKFAFKRSDSMPSRVRSVQPLFHSPVALRSLRGNHFFASLPSARLGFASFYEAPTVWQKNDRPTAPYRPATDLKETAGLDDKAVVPLLHRSSDNVPVRSHQLPPAYPSPGPLWLRLSRMKHSQKNCAIRCNEKWRRSIVEDIRYPREIAVRSALRAPTPSVAAANFWQQGHSHATKRQASTHPHWLARPVQYVWHFLRPDGHDRFRGPGPRIAFARQPMFQCEPAIHPTRQPKSIRS